MATEPTTPNDEATNGATPEVVTPSASAESDASAPVTSAPMAPTAPGPAQNLKGFALAALIVGIVAFMVGLVPVLGIILGAGAAALGTIALVKKQPKGLAVTGLALGGVALLVSLSTTIALGAGLSSLADLTGTAVSEPAEPDAPAEAGEANSEEPASAVGTRDNPAAIGSEITSDDWTVVVNSYLADGSAVVAANGYNDPAPAGSHYVVVNYTVTYTGTESSLAAEIGVDLVTSGGNVINSYDTFVMLDDSMGLDELFTGASATGSTAFVIPDGEGVTLRVRPGFLADEVFVAAS